MKQSALTLTTATNAAAVTVAMLLGVAGCATDPSAGPVDPNKPPAVDLYVSGVRAYDAGDKDRAIRELETAVAKNPDLLMARNLLGELYKERNDFTAASVQYEVLTEKDPYTLSNHYNLGVCYQFLDRLKDAAVAYLRGLQLDPKDFKSNMNLGAVYLALGEIDDAVNYLDKATQIDPQSGVAWSNLGVALDARGSLLLAETSYRRSLELDSDSLATLQNLGSNLIQQNKPVEATVIWNQVVERQKTPFTLMRLADAYAGAKDYTKAQQYYDEAIKLDGRSVPAINAKADALIKQYEEGLSLDEPKRKAALALWKKSLQLNGTQADVAEKIKKWGSGTRFGS